MDSLFYRKTGRRFGLRSSMLRLLHNRKATAVLLVGVLAGGFLLFSNHGILQRIRLQQQKTELEQKIREAEEETKSLQSQSRALDGDRKAIEKVARERYGMARPGERVYKVQKNEH
jgi:cell division protein FtsB